MNVRQSEGRGPGSREAPAGDVVSRVRSVAQAHAATEGGGWVRSLGSTARGPVRGASLAQACTRRMRNSA